MAYQQTFPFSDLTTPTPEIQSRLSALHGHGEANRNATYHDAMPKAPSDRERILMLLRTDQHFLSGLTRDAIAVELDMQLATVCGRCRELLTDHEEGQPPAIYETTLRRPTRTGSSAVVLCAREKQDNQ